MAGAGTAVNGLSATTVIAGTADTPLTGTNVRQKIGVKYVSRSEERAKRLGDRLGVNK